MNLNSKIFAYFYAVALSLWAVVIPQGENFFHENQSNKLEISSGKVGSLDELENVYLVGQNNNQVVANFWGYGLDKIDHFFNTSLFQGLYWRKFGATVLSYLEVVNIKFETTDIIFPFHFFW